MAGSRPKPPGWYPDPDILPGSNTTLRYWNGRHWTDRRRPMPVLTSLDIGGAYGVPLARALEGRVETASLPAPAAEITATRDGPPGFAEPRASSSDVIGNAPSVTSDGRGVPPSPPQRGGGGGGGGGDGDGAEQHPVARTRKPKKPWWLYAGVAVLAAVAVGLIGEAVKPVSNGPRVITDTQFVRLANADCAKTLPGLRPDDPGELGAAVTPAQAASQMDTAADGLVTLANRLAALPIIAADRPFVAAWLVGWHSYAAIGHEYAANIRQHQPTSAKEPPFLATAATIAKATDKFSRANGLKSCEWAYSDNTSASDF